MLELENQKFRPKIRILHNMSSLEPAPKVLETEIQVQQSSFFLSRKYKAGCSGFLVVSDVPELYWKLREACREKTPLYLFQIRAHGAHLRQHIHRLRFIEFVYLFFQHHILLHVRWQLLILSYAKMDYR